MVNSAEADIVSPSVAAEDPLALLGCIILVGNDISACITVAALDCFDHSLSCRTVALAACKCVDILLASVLYSCIISICHDLFCICLDRITDSLLSEEHTETELCIILKE